MLLFGNLEGMANLFQSFVFIAYGYFYYIGYYMFFVKMMACTIILLNAIKTEIQVQIQGWLLGNTETYLKKTGTISKWNLIP